MVLREGFEVIWYSVKPPFKICHISKAFIIRVFGNVCHHDSIAVTQILCYTKDAELDKDIFLTE